MPSLVGSEMCIRDSSINYYLRLVLEKSVERVVDNQIPGSEGQYCYHSYSKYYYEYARRGTPPAQEASSKNLIPTSNHPRLYVEAELNRKKYPGTRLPITSLGFPSSVSPPKCGCYVRTRYSFGTQLRVRLGTQQAVSRYLVGYGNACVDDQRRERPVVGSDQ